MKRLASEMSHVMMYCAKVFLLVAGFACSILADEDTRTDSSVGWRQFEDPEVVESHTKLIWPDDIQQPWLRSLDIEESDLRREAADTISLALRVGLEPIPEFEPRLLTIAGDVNELPATRLSAAHALVACNYVSAAEQMAEMLNDAPFVMKVLIEHGLAKWGYQPMASVWLERLGDRDANPQLYQAALTGLQVLGETEAIPLLKQVVLSKKESLTKRLMAAESWAQIATISDLGVDDLLSVSERLLIGAPSENSPDLLLGMRLVWPAMDGTVGSGKSAELLEKYADHPWYVVKGDALKKLLVVKPEAVLVRAEENISSSDANVRRATVDSLVLDKSQRSVVLLGKALSDQVPEIRRAAREHLLIFAADENWKEAVIAEAAGILGSDSWRGIEQSLIILTRLQYRQARTRVVELLQHSRPEVFVTAAWSLKMLAEEDWAPQMYDLFSQKLDKIDKEYDLQESYAAAHLIEALGMLGYRQALPSFGKFFPKTATYSVRMRCAAIWSAGFLADPKKDSNVRSVIQGRLMDFASVPPEAPEVRAMAAIALGRMKAIESLEVLRERAEQEGRASLVGSRAHWAVAELTGEPMPEVPTINRTIGGWSIQTAKSVLD